MPQAKVAAAGTATGDGALAVLGADVAATGVALWRLDIEKTSKELMGRPFAGKLASAAA